MFHLNSLGRLFLAAALFFPAGIAATVQIQPTPATVALGDSITLDLRLGPVTDLYAWQFDLAFDPTILSATTVSEGDFLLSGGSTLFLPGSIDNDLGLISFNADTLETEISGISGSGLLLQVQFQALSLGTSFISISNLQLLDSQLNEISASVSDGEVTVATPEPASFALAALALILGAVVTRRRRRLVPSALTALCLLSTRPSLQAADIPSAQFDASRTQANPAEIFLTTSNVGLSRFGKLFSLTVDGPVFAQPVYAQGVTVGTRKLNLVYIVTSHNSVYAFDADNPASNGPVWSANFGAWETPEGWPTGLGILSTPLIVRSTGALYLTSATYQNNVRTWRLHALDLATGAPKSGSPAVISGSVTGTAGDSVNGVIAFSAARHVQRAGLAQTGNNVILAFAPDRDHPPYHGWVFTYSLTTLQQTGVFSSTRNNVWDYGSGAGIWQSGRAPAVDPAGSAYFETGNGQYDGNLNFGESVLKLSPSPAGLALADWFTPANWSTLNDWDYDLGSTGPTLIPGTNLAFVGSKTGTAYLLNTGNLGHLSPTDASVVQAFSATSGCAVPLDYQGCAQIMGQVLWSTATNPLMYVWAVHDVLRAYQFVNGRFNTVPVSVGLQQAYYPGGVLSMSSYQGLAGTGIVWAITSETPDLGFYFGPGFTGSATLRAFDANNLANELWNSNQNPLRDSLGAFASFAPAVAVNGKVYAPTFSNQVAVYGLLNGPIPGDLNGDNIVDCADLTIVKNSYGKSSSQPGFDLRADINSDGIVNLVDLATESRRMPAGSACK